MNARAGVLRSGRQVNRRFVASADRSGSIEARHDPMRASSRDRCVQ
jgi:hypothetical protein